MGMSVFKITGYAGYGFDFIPYLTVIAATVVISFVGTAIGRRISDTLADLLQGRDDGLGTALLPEDYEVLEKGRQDLNLLEIPPFSGGYVAVDIFSLSPKAGVSKSGPPEVTC